MFGSLFYFLSNIVPNSSSDAIKFAYTYFPIEMNCRITTKYMNMIVKPKDTCDTSNIVKAKNNKKELDVCDKKKKKNKERKKRYVCNTM